MTSDELKDLAASMLADEARKWAGKLRCGDVSVSGLDCDDDNRRLANCLERMAENYQFYPSLEV